MWILIDFDDEFVLKVVAAPIHSYNRIKPNAWRSVDPRIRLSNWGVLKNKMFQISIKKYEYVHYSKYYVLELFLYPRWRRSSCDLWSWHRRAWEDLRSSSWPSCDCSVVCRSREDVRRSCQDRWERRTHPLVRRCLGQLSTNWQAQSLYWREKS